jgi:hypothetical protein
LTIKKEILTTGTILIAIYNWFNGSLSLDLEM